MNIVLKISLLIMYVLFAQVYPVAHLHMHKCGEETRLTLSNHSPDIPVNDLAHKLYHEHAKNHNHINIHCIGELDYTAQTKSINLQPFMRLQLCITDMHHPGVVTNIYVQKNPIRIPPQFFPGLLPERAPPKTI